MIDINKTLFEVIEELKTIFDNSTQTKYKELIHKAFQGLDTTMIEALYKEIQDICIELETISISKINLSKKIYTNTKMVEDEILKIMNEASKANLTVQRIKNEYDFDLYKKNIANWIIRGASQSDLTSQGFVSTKFNSKMTDIVMKKQNFYLNRVIVTEIQRAKELANREYFKNNENIEYLKFEMNSLHKKRDICDIFKNKDVGFGIGIIRKEDAVTLPLHPHCKCKYRAYFGKIKKSINKTNENGIRDYLNTLSDNDLKDFMSKKDIDKLKSGSNPIDILNQVRPNYPLY